MFISLVVEEANILYMSENALYVTNIELGPRVNITNIHKITVGNSEMRPVSDGVVTGEVRNQFWMDEHDGNLRVCAVINEDIHNRAQS